MQLVCQHCCCGCVPVMLLSTIVSFDCCVLLLYPTDCDSPCMRLLVSYVTCSVRSTACRASSHKRSVNTAWLLECGLLPLRG